MLKINALMVLVIVIVNYNNSATHTIWGIIHVCSSVILVQVKERKVALSTGWNKIS